MVKKFFKILVVLLIPLLLTSCFGNDATNIGNGDDDLNGEWSVYNNDYLSSDYLNQWNYFEQSDTDGELVVFSPEELDLEESKELSEDIIYFELYILNLDYMLNTNTEIDENDVKNAEDCIDELKIVIEQRINENIEDYSKAEMKSRSIDGQKGFEVEYFFRLVLIYEIHYDLSIIENDIDEIKNILEKFNNKEEFAENITILELEEIKEILKKDENDYTRLIEDIDFYLEQGTAKVFLESKTIYTYINDKIIFIKSLGMEEVYNNNREIIEIMINSIEFK